MAQYRKDFPLFTHYFDFLESLEKKFQAVLSDMKNISLPFNSAKKIQNFITRLFIAPQ